MQLVQLEIKNIIQSEENWRRSTADFGMTANSYDGIIQETEHDLWTQWYKKRNMTYKCNEIQNETRINRNWWTI